MSYTILVVDNAPYARKLLKKMLEDHGHTVIGEAEGTREAVEFYRMTKPDLVTVDLMLDGENGIDTIREVLKLDPDARMIAVSALIDYRAADRISASGAKAYATKSGGWPALEAAIAQAFRAPQKPA